MVARPTRILFIRFSSIGDILLTAPAVASLRKAVHGPCEIHYLTKHAFLSTVEGLGDLVDKIHTIEHGTGEVTEALRAEQLDYIIDLHNNVRSRAVKRTLGLISFTVNKQNWAKWLLVRGWRNAPVEHIVHRYIGSFSEAFNAQLPTHWPPLFPDAQAPVGLPETYVVLAIGAAHQRKALSDALVDAIFEREQRPVVFIGGPEDVTRAQTLHERHPEAIQLTGQTDLAGSAAVLRGAAHAYAGDTGMMHLAAAVGTPVTSFWGCTRPSLGMAPWLPAPGSELIVPLEEPHRPCSKLGNRCRHQPPCMGQLQFPVSD